MATQGQGFVQLPPRPQGQSQQPFQPGFGNVNHTGPTPPPHPPMGQMPPGHQGGQPRPIGNHQGTAYAQPQYGRSGSHDLSSPTPHGMPQHGMSQHHSPQGRSARRARPVVHNALERRAKPRTQICDLRTRVTSEHEARNALSSYVVWTIKKDGDAAGIDPEGNLVVPTWARAKHSEDTGVSQEEAARRVCDLQLDTEPVSDKKARLTTAIQDQIQYAQEQLEDQEEDPETYCYELKQFHQSIKRVEVSPYLTEQHFGDDQRSSHSRSSRSHGRYSSKDKKKRDKYKKSFSLYDTPKYKKSKTKTQKQTDSITAYFRRKPRDGVNCLQMWEDLQHGNDDWDRPRSPSRYQSQQSFNGTGQHSAQQGGFRQQQPMGNHQAGQMRPNHAPFHQGFGQQGAQHNMPQQAGMPHQQQFGHQNQGAFGQSQPMPNMPRGVQQHPEAPNQQHAFPQAQYAQNQGQQSGVQPNQRFPQGNQGSGPAGQHQQARPGQSGAPQAFQQGVGVKNGAMGRGNAPNQGVRPQVYNAQQKNVPPVPPMHGRPEHRRGTSPRVFPTSPRSSGSSFSDRDSGSDSDTSIETPASSVGSRGRRSNRQPKASRGRTRTRGRDHKVYGVPSREHSKAPPYPRPVSPPTYHPRSAMRTPSRSGLRQQEFGRTTPRHFMDDADQFARQRLNSFDHEMLGRKMTGDFSHRSPPRRAYSDHFEYMPREAFPRRTVLSDFDQPLPRRPMMDGFDEPRAMRGGNGMDFRRVSPGSARRAMFGEDDLDRLSEDLDGLRLDRGFGGAGRRAFVGPDRLERGFRDRFRGREYYGDDDLKHTRFADGTPGLNYGRPTGRAFVNDGYRTLGRGRAASYWGE